MPENCFAVVTVDAANARLQSNVSSAIVSIVKRGERLSIRAISAPDAKNFIWVSVHIPAVNSTAWLRGDLVQITGDCADLGVISTSPSSPAENPAPPDSDILTGDCQGEVITASATVRSGAGISNASRGYINRGTKFIIQDISEPDAQGFRWYEFNFNNAPGWVREDLIKETGDCLDLHSHSDPEPIPQPNPSPIPNPSPTPTPAPQPQPDSSACVAVVGLSQVSVRADATTTSNRIGFGNQNEQFAVQGLTAPQADGFTWVKINFNGQTGYIRSDLVSLSGNCSNFVNDPRLPRPAIGRITQGFRPANNPTHNGIDIGTNAPQELRTPLPAVVERVIYCTKCTDAQPNYYPSDPAIQRQIFNDAGWGFGYGNCVVLRYNLADIPRPAQEQFIRTGANAQSNIYVLYAHLSAISVQSMQNLATNGLIGKTGNTGFSSAHHLHLEVAFGRTWGTATKLHPSILFAVENV